MEASFEKCLELLDNAVLAKVGRHLSDPEVTIIRGTWNDLGFVEIAQNSPYGTNYLQRVVAPALWDMLSGVVGKGERVGKMKLRYHMEKLAGFLDSSNPQTSSKLPPFTQSFLGGSPPNTSNFRGREDELGVLKKLVLAKRCVAVIGGPGIGKSALVAKLVEIVGSESQDEFDIGIWKTIHSSSTFPELLSSLIKLLAGANVDLPEDTDAQISVLINYLQTRRYLIVLDDAQIILRGERIDSSSPYGRGKTSYDLLFRRIVEELQQSCVVLVSHFASSDLTRLEQHEKSFKSLLIKGLKTDDAIALLEKEGLADSENLRRLIEFCEGNPLNLRQAANRIQNLFGGNIEKYLSYPTLVANDLFEDDFRQLFDSETNLSNLEKTVLVYLADETAQSANSITFTKLLSDLKVKHETTPALDLKLFRVLEELSNLSLVKIFKDQRGETLLTLQPLVKKYILTNRSEIMCS